MTPSKVWSELSICEGQRCPHFGLVWITEVGRRDSDNGERTTVHIERSSDHLRICAKPALPETVSKYNGGISALLLFFGSESSSKLGLDSKQLEEIG